MSYFVADKTGYLGDFASCGGIADLRESAGPHLRYFLDTGHADDKLAKLIIAECADVPEQQYIAGMFGKAKPPIILTDGIIEDETEEQAPKAKPA